MGGIYSSHSVWPGYLPATGGNGYSCFIISYHPPGTESAQDISNDEIFADGDGNIHDILALLDTENSSQNVSRGNSLKQS